MAGSAVIRRDGAALSSCYVTTIKRDVTIPLVYQEEPLRGDVVLGMHNPGARALLLLTEQGVTVLSCYVPQLWQYLNPGEICIRDYGEQIGMALRLENAGVIKIISYARIGLLGWRICIVRPVGG